MVEIILSNKTVMLNFSSVLYFYKLVNYKILYTLNFKQKKPSLLCGNCGGVGI